MAVSHSARRTAAPALAALAALALIVALFAGYGSRALFNPEQFSERATSALAEEAVANELASRIAGDLVSADPNLIAVRPVLEEVLAGVVRSSTFRGLLRAGLADVHRAVFQGDTSTVTLTIADVGATARGALAAFNPKLARKIPAASAAEVLTTDPPAPVLKAVQLAENVKPLPWIGLGAAVLLLGAALWTSPDRRRTVLGFGIALGVGSVIALVGLEAIRALVLSGADEGGPRDAVAGLWHAFAFDLETALLLLGAAGAVIAAAASSLLRPVDVAAQLRRGWALVTTVPERPRARALRALGLLAAGILIVVRHQAFVELAAILVGLYIAYAGAAELLRMTIPATPESERGARRGRSALAASAVVALAILAGGAIFIGTGGTSAESLAVETEGCNGSEALCDRSYEEAAVPATHNSMSAASYPGWLFAQQEAGLGAQLRDGVRGLLIDAHYGSPTADGPIKTDLSSLDSAEREVYVEELGEDALDAALRVRDRLVGGKDKGERGVYLCHRFCELGAIAIDRALGEVRDFLAANPDEVVSIVIEDYVAPEEIEAAFERSGLIDYVYMGPLEDPFPTLGEMVGSGGRVVVMAEKDAGDGTIPWYHPVYEELVQETPYSFKKPEELTDPKLIPGELRGEPRTARRSAVPDQSLDRHQPGSEALERPEGERARRARRADRRVRAAARAAGEPDRGRLLPRGRPSRGGRRPQRGAGRRLRVALSRSAAGRGRCAPTPPGPRPRRASDPRPRPTHEAAASTGRPPPEGARRRGGRG